MIINSLLDTDLYKFTMQQVVLHQFNDVSVIYKFNCRNEDIEFTYQMVKEIQTQIKHLCSLQFTKTELNYLSNLRFIKDDYIRFLKNFSLNYDYIRVYRDEAKELHIKIEGPWIETILFETPILSIVSEVYMKSKFDNQKNIRYRHGLDRLNKKIEKANKYEFYYDFPFVDFGTRRRFSKEWHEKVIQNLNEENLLSDINFVGTSNVYFAKKYDLKPIGTMAHEFFQACQGFHIRPEESQKYALEKWSQEYRGDLGIALSDTLGIDKFLEDFDMYYAKLFDGLRHDSGDPYEWGEKVIKHYKDLGIDPSIKKAIFSDGLTFKEADCIYRYFKNKLNVSFGIGTNLTNDVGVKPLNIVIKMQKCNGRPVAKISDSAGKTMCQNKKYLSYLKRNI